jgi:hypothetical protein
MSLTQKAHRCLFFNRLACNGSFHQGSEGGAVETDGRTPEGRKIVRAHRQTLQRANGYGSAADTTGARLKITGARIAQSPTYPRRQKSKFVWPQKVSRDQKNGFGQNRSRSD